MKTILISEILDYLQGENLTFTFYGDKNARVSGFSSLGHYKDNSFTWVKKQENWEQRPQPMIPALIFVQSGVVINAPNYIVSEQSKRAFFSTIEHFYDVKEEKPAIGPGTYLSETVKLGKNVLIGANCTLDGDITIGDDTVIEPNVTVENHVRIGCRCIIQAGCRIGADGFAYTEDENHKKLMVRHYGGVFIGDDVFLGTNSEIARGQIDDTVIENGSKIDSLIHIAHNVCMGEDSAAVAGSIVMGSVEVGKNAYIASAMVRNQCVLEENAFVGMGAVVTKDVPANVTVVGNPAKPFIPKEK